MSRSTLPTRHALSSLSRQIQAFYGKDTFAGLGPSLMRKKPTFRVIFAIVRQMSKSRLLNIMLVAGVLLNYRVLRLPPTHTGIFQFGMSQNNIKSFDRLNRCLPQQVRDQICINGQETPFSRRIATVLSPKLMWDAGCALKETRQRSELAHLQAVIGCAALLLYSRPLPEHLKVICIANDHSPIASALTAVARQQGRGTCYTQHAPVTEHFPHLNYDLAVLFDRASKRAYELAAERSDLEVATQVVILPPFEEEFRQPTASAAPYKVGLCLSYLPDMEGLRALVRLLSDSPDVSAIQMRRHPRCRHNWSAFTRINKVDLRPQDELATAFFANVDMVLTPNSGVTIESMHYGRPTFYVPGTDTITDDYYGFVAEGLVPVFSKESLAAPAAFFDEEWKNRFKIYDETTMSSLPDLRETTGRAFLDLL